MLQTTSKFVPPFPLGSLEVFRGDPNQCFETTYPYLTVVIFFCFQGTDTSKLEKLMFKMGIFTVLYIIPAIVILACDGYHAYILQLWYPSTIACKRYGGADKGMCRRPPQPQVRITPVPRFVWNQKIKRIRFSV